MPKSVKIAVVQMKASPAPTKERLERAEKFVIECAERGAQIVVLPEVFNTGYEYSDQNYLQAESFDGLTATWMKKISARYHVHLTGSFFRRERTAIFNTMLLVAPNGQQWHYDKHYPWLWERAYFQKGINTTIADTEFGKIGFLICWDVAHLNLWQQYSGKIDLMLVSSCPPKALDLALVFPDGKRIMSKNTGALTQYMRRTSDKTFGEYLRRQASYLGIPVAQATSTGIFTSSLPNPKSSLSMLSVVYPPLLKYKPQFDHARMEANYFNETYIADNSGNILQSVQPDTEGFAVSDVIIHNSPPQSKGKQPAFGIPKSMYLIDSIAEMMFASEYNRKTQRYLSKQALSTNNGG
jgi:predicted amidohydrolase